MQHSMQLPITSYQQELLIFMCVIGVIALVIFVTTNLLLLALKTCNVFYEKKVWLLINLVCILIFLAIVIPVILDICQSCYCEVADVVKIEVEVKANNSSKYIIVTDSTGKTYTCYDYLVNTELLKNVSYPGTVVFAKHSKLMLDYFPQNP